MTGISNYTITDSLAVDDRPEVTISQNKVYTHQVSPPRDEYWLLNTVMIYFQPSSSTKSGSHAAIVSLIDDSDNKWKLITGTAAHDERLMVWPAQIAGGEINQESAMSVQRAVRGIVLEPNDKLDFSWENNTDTDFVTGTSDESDAQMRVWLTGAIVEL